MRKTGTIRGYAINHRKVPLIICQNSPVMPLSGIRDTVHTEDSAFNAYFSFPNYVWTLTQDVYNIVPWGRSIFLTDPSNKLCSTPCVM
ncbi:hypothetical protein BABINDRAFT_109792 [Babjeviella inositovora NRRL Y-12698]|uniref:Uncharacterized protein n=1 Tax=Babjeviella inositovora NRRL Y-12698 TaxID=984486 RepID=A0A1E3QXB0_9ASCO|nr:uncharacterized protein BABINDRAFT_109792 [Babjeviella inositovora NRRL Y-12698]ODQ81647.1 hypothetical protein BABINDRAFT_109792 [Babjeviella inositovora NRRL Y-12698]